MFLDVPIFVRFRAGGVEDGVVVTDTGDLHLDAALSLVHGLLGDQEGELTGKAAAGVLHAADLGTVAAILVNDPCAGGYRAGVGKLHLYPAAVHPGLADHLVDLLHIRLAVNGDGVGVGLVGGGRQPGAEGLSPVHASLVNFLGSLQHPLGRRLIRTAGIDLQVVDAPVGQQVAPQGHLGSVVGFILAVHPQGLQGSVRIAGGHDAQHLGIRAFLVGQILDAGTGGDGLRYALEVRVDAVAGDLAGLARWGLVVIVGVLLFPDGAVDGKVVRFRAIPIDADLAQGLLLAGGGLCRGREHSQHGEQGQEQG